ncbi:alanine aminotransferase 2-like [Choristoneura fumiferana]|uniref:alanine aminotransferase 2-like n=1 Tax=Choristoneura fumiferana TaxID=7141 RepID=UPI003D15BA8E
MEEVVRFAHEHRLFLLADEVYQENLVDKPFVSFKKVIHSMGPPYDTLELASFMTASKGWAAECGARAALVDIPRLAPQARAAFEDARARAHCPSLLGQCALDCIVKPPAPGEPSYSQFSLERDVIQRALRERAAAAHRALNDIPTFSCNPIEAAMFAFPRFTIPARAHAAARARGVEPDEFYCMQLLEETGLCVVAGAGFGQAPLTLHLRCTVLHAPDQLRYMLRQLKTFHLRFLEEYRDEEAT